MSAIDTDRAYSDESDEAHENIAGLFLDLGAEGNEGDANEKDTDHISLIRLTPRSRDRSLSSRRSTKSNLGQPATLSLSAPPAFPFSWPNNVSASSLSSASNFSLGSHPPTPEPPRSASALFEPASSDGSSDDNASPPLASTSSKSINIPQKQDSDPATPSSSSSSFSSSSSSLSTSHPKNQVIPIHILPSSTETTTTTTPTPTAQPPPPSSSPLSSNSSTSSSATTTTTSTFSPASTPPLTSPTREDDDCSIDNTTEETAADQEINRHAGRGSFIPRRTASYCCEGSVQCEGPVFAAPYDFYNQDIDVFNMRRARPVQLSLLSRMREELAADQRDPNSEAAIPLRTCFKYCLLRHTVLHELAMIDDVEGLEILFASYAVVASAGATKFPTQFLRKRPTTLSGKQRRYTLRLLDLDWTNPYGETALWVAAGNSSRFFFRLVQAGATVPSPTCSLLHAATTLAAVKGDLSVLRWLLEQTPLKPDTDNQFGETPLHFAAGLGSTDAAELLLSKGADINRRSFRLGLSPVVYAVKHRQSAVSLLLIENAAKVTGRAARSLGSEALLHLAARRQASYEVMLRLIQLGCRIDKATCSDCHSDDLATCCDMVPSVTARWIKSEIAHAHAASKERKVSSPKNPIRKTLHKLRTPTHRRTDNKGSGITPPGQSDGAEPADDTSLALAGRVFSAPEALARGRNDDDLVDIFDFLRSRPNSEPTEINIGRSPLTVDSIALRNSEHDSTDSSCNIGFTTDTPDSTHIHEFLALHPPPSVPVYLPSPPSSPPLPGTPSSSSSSSSSFSASPSTPSPLAVSSRLQHCDDEEVDLLDMLKNPRPEPQRPRVKRSILDLFRNNKP